MSMITGFSLHNPVQQYSLVERKTSGANNRIERTQYDSVQKKVGFKWKGLGIEYQSQDIRVSSAALPARQFIHELSEAQEIKTFSRHHDNRHYGPLEPRSAATAYARQRNAHLDYLHPMINISV